MIGGNVTSMGSLQRGVWCLRSLGSLLPLCKHVASAIFSEHNPEMGAAFTIWPRPVCASLAFLLRDKRYEMLSSGPLLNFLRAVLLPDHFHSISGSPVACLTGKAGLVGVHHCIEGYPASDIYVIAHSALPGSRRSLNHWRSAFTQSKLDAESPNGTFHIARLSASPVEQAGHFLSGNHLAVSLVASGMGDGAEH